MPPTSVTPASPSCAGTLPTGVRARLRRHAVLSFFLIAYGLSWAVWLPMALAGARISEGQAWPSLVPGLLGPVAAAFIMAGVVAGPAGVCGLFGRMMRWRVAGVWYLVALSPLVFYAVAVLAQAARGQGRPDLAAMGRFSGLPVAVFPVMGLLLLGTGYAEETGWRGFAADEWLKSRSLLWTAVVVGLLWALWHVPSMFVIESYRQMGVMILPLFTLGIVSGSIVLAWLYRASGGSVLLVALWHGCYDLVTGTAAAGAVPAAVVTTGVMVWAVAIVVAEVRKGHRAGIAKTTTAPTAEGALR
jgi:membrane protease YdiL (CAAX protease family)